jgi:hypothetical protein
MKRIKTYKRFTIYERSERELRNDIGFEKYCVFLPECSPDAMDSPDWECASFREAIDFIDSYGH